MTSHAIRHPASRIGTRSDDASRSTGSLAVAVAAVAFSTAGLFTRLITADVWTMLFWRGLFGGLLIAATIVWQERARTRAAFAAVGWAGVVTASCSTVATICFITALRETTVADVTIIYATAPFIAALIAWAWTREQPPRTTIAASGVALIGVVIMCGGPLSKGHALGDLLALAMTGLMAFMMVVIRKNRQVSMLPATCLSAFACAVAVFPLSHPMAVTQADLLLLVLFGTVQFGIGLLLLTVGSRLIAATRSSLLANLELPSHRFGFGWPLMRFLPCSRALVEESSLLPCWRTRRPTQPKEPRLPRSSNESAVTKTVTLPSLR